MRGLSTSKAGGSCYFNLLHSYLLIRTSKSLLINKHPNRAEGTRIVWIGERTLREGSSLPTYAPDGDIGDLLIDYSLQSGSSQ